MRIQSLPFGQSHVLKLVQRICFFGPLLAMTAAAADSVTNATEQLPPVTVTGQKEPADIQTVPVSITAVTQADLQDADVRSVKDASMYAPNTFLTEFSARKLSAPRFRGIGAGPDNPGVTTFIDGVPQLNGNSSSIELLDINQIEFVRGPQSALYGRNTAGGLINITSSKPSLTGWTGDAHGTYGNFDLWDGRVSTSAPIIQDKMALGAAFGYSSRDGYTVDDATGRDVDSRKAFFGKGQLLWAPSQDWEMRLILTAERAQDGDYSLGDRAALHANPYHVSRNFDGETDRDVFAPTLLINHSTPTIDFSLTTGFVYWKTFDYTDYDYSPIPAASEHNSERDSQFTQEIRLSSAKDAPVSISENLKLKWQAGLFFFSQDYDQNKYIDVLTPFGPFRSSTIASKDDIGGGAYAQLTLTAWDKLDVSGAVRGDYENKDGKIGALSKSHDFTDASPQFSLAYHLRPSQTVYASVARGYKAGGFSAGGPAGTETYGQERSWNYEIGAKTTWLDEKVSANLSAYYTDWDNLQVYIPPAFYIGNAGKAYSEGVELEVHARPVKSLDLFAGAGLMDARFLNGSVSAGAAVGGNKLTFSPDYTLNGGAEFSIPLCKAATFYLRGEGIAYGNYKFDDANTLNQNSYAVANFRGGIRGKNWYAEGWARNAFDRRYDSVAFYAPVPVPGGSGVLAELGAPATFGVTVGIRF